MPAHELSSLYDYTSDGTSTLALLKERSSIDLLQRGSNSNNNKFGMLQNPANVGDNSLERMLLSAAAAANSFQPTENAGEDAMTTALYLQMQLEKQKQQNMLENFLLSKLVLPSSSTRALQSAATACLGGNGTHMPSTGDMSQQDLLNFAYRLGQMSSERKHNLVQDLMPSLHQNHSLVSTPPLPSPSSCIAPQSLSQQRSSLTLQASTGPEMGKNYTFPQKLHQCLTDLEKQEFGMDIACFLPNGRSFMIRRPLDFVNHIMPKYFERMSHFSSFQRQLNLYDFKRVTEGPDTGAYYHELFLQGQPLLCTWMKRNKIKGGKHNSKATHKSSASLSSSSSSSSSVSSASQQEQRSKVTKKNSCN